MADDRWYSDGIIYEVHVRSFFDSDGDGIGDFAGLTRRLDYIEELGVTALWLLPFYPSPLRDDGYDIADYTDIHPDYGTLSDFQYFLDEAHRRGLKVITELVINHTSDEHPWFQRARQAPRDSTERNFYIWSDTPDRFSQARVVFPDVKDSNWSYDPVADQYYWHRFYSHQPDLNFDNPAVRRAIFDIVDFWMEMGVDGLRLDAITYLYMREGTDGESLPETHALLRDLRAHIDKRYDDRMLLAEANQWPEDAIDYFGSGDECHMAFHFPLMPRLFMGVEMEDRQPIVDILEQTPEIPDGCQWALFLRNHDELTLEMVTDEERDLMYRSFAPELRMRVNLGIRRRLAPMLRGDLRKIQLMYGMLLALPGTPILYYGDEIAMGDNYHLGDRDGVRTPMQWSADRNAGFSRANPQSLYLPVITDPEYHYLATNVETQENNPSSLLRWLKRRIDIRRRNPALSGGSLEIVDCTNYRVLAFIRRIEGHSDMLVVINLSRAARHVHLDLSDDVGRWPIEKWGRTQFPPVRDGEAAHYPLSLGPYELFWFELADEPLRRETQPMAATAQKPLEVRQQWTEIFEGRLRPQFERHLWSFLQQQHWFNPRSRPIDSLEASERTRLRWEHGPTIICLVEVRFLDGDNEIYALPLECSSDRRDGESRPRTGRSVVTEIEFEQRDQRAVLYDATTDPRFASVLLKFIRKEWKIDGLEGAFRGHWVDAFQDIDPSELASLVGQPTELDHTHTSLVFGRRVVMKLFRRLERGRSIDVEMGQYLVGEGFDGAADFVGHLDYHRGRWEPTTLATIHAYVPHDTDGWSWYCDRAEQQLRPAASEAACGVASSPMLTARHLIDTAPRRLFDEPSCDDFYDAAAVLGRRTASLHQVLARGRPDTPFEPEPLTTDYERARYHWMRRLTAHTFRLLRRQLSNHEAPAQLARWVLEHEGDILDRFQALVARGVGGLRMRIHGDYHLQEVLRSGEDFVIIDFEGHPWLAPGERRIKRSPLRDVATMLRSFHTACLRTWRRRLDGYHIGDDDRRRLQLFHRAQSLYAASCSAMLDGYLQTCGSASFLPGHPDAVATLLDALRLKKAIHQLGHDIERSEDPTVALMGVASLLMDEH